MLSWLLYVALAFACGSLPFSVWIGRMALGVDVRAFGDGNPGAWNVFRAGGKASGVLVLLLDFLKGALPVALARWQGGLGGVALASVAVAPVLGHAFSPWLGFRGGKALVVSFGMWAGLTLWPAPVLLGVGLAVWLALLASEGWTVMLGMLTLLTLLTLPVWPPFVAGAGVLLLAWVGDVVVLAWKHRADLKRRPVLRPWLKRRLQTEVG